VALGAVREEMIFLGLRQDTGQAIFATVLPMTDEDLAERADLQTIDLRTLALQDALPPEDMGALAQARALVHWHRTHRFCSRCGEKTNLAEAGYRRDCPSCGGQHFPRTDPCVIMLITDEAGDRALLGRPSRLPEGIYTTLAGFMEPGETIEQAVRRETLEESGIKVGEVRLISNQPWPFPANLMLGCIGTATSSVIDIEDDELEDCKWCDRDEVRQMVAGTHPQGHKIPPSISIAFELISGWLENRIP
jgi:NAD+ diphosphatase